MTEQLESLEFEHTKQLANMLRIEEGIVDDWKREVDGKTNDGGWISIRDEDDV
jgi:hypothetical protein